MRIHEYQGKEILKRYFIPVPTGRVVSTKADIDSFIKENNEYPQVLKAQIHAGGRGKAGGVLRVEDSCELKQFTANLLGKKLVTSQTGPDGKMVRTLLIEKSVEILKEFYLGILVDRNLQKIVMMISDRGGKNIEISKKDDPSSIKKIFINPNKGLNLSEVDRVFTEVGIAKDKLVEFRDISKNLYKAFDELDASLAEINPLALDEKNQLIALDSKWNFDPNGLSRQLQLVSLRDPHEEDELEIESYNNNLAYIKLEGTIGCMVNGAGLAMATMDIIKLLGGTAANFLDVGGGASIEKVSKAFQIMCMHPEIKVGFINIFGGIMRCDFVAEGLTNALKTTNRNLPLVVRIKGFKEVEAKKILKGFSSKIEIIDSFQLAAQRAVALANS